MREQAHTTEEWAVPAIRVRLPTLGHHTCVVYTQQANILQLQLLKRSKTDCQKKNPMRLLLISEQMHFSGVKETRKNRTDRPEQTMEFPASLRN